MLIPLSGLTWQNLENPQVCMTMPSILSCVEYFISLLKMIQGIYFFIRKEKLIWKSCQRLENSFFSNPGCVMGFEKIVRTLLAFRWPSTYFPFLYLLRICNFYIKLYESYQLYPFFSRISLYTLLYNLIK